MKIAIAVLYAAFLVIAPMVYHWRPLIPSPGLRATCVDGRSIPREARVYRMLFRPWAFVEFPDRGSWFVVDLDNRAVAFPTASPGRSPYLHYNHDMNLGVPVDDTLKGSGEWRVSWSDGQVVWSNGDVTVRLRGT